MEGTDYKELAHKFIEGRASETEIRTLENWYNSRTQQQRQLSWDAETEELIKMRMRNRIIENIRQPKRGIFLTILFSRKTAVAASLLIIMGAAYLLFQRNQATTKSPVIVSQNFDVPAGGNNAILTLASGRKINLNTINKGETIEIEGSRITKDEEGLISYQITEEKTGETVNNTKTNTITTPAGGQYALILPDGSRVKLNARSSLTYPQKFSNENRRVTLSGEGYFQVAKDKHRPFLVSSGEQVVEVLGTQFNINAYADEKKIVTTLEEGSVKVSSGANSKIIKPAQQTLISKGSGIEVQDADLEQVLGWKNGKMVFVHTDLESVMRQISRWYNIEVRIEANVKKPVTGKISRDMNLDDLLKVLGATGINFRMEQQGQSKTLVITP